MNNRLIASVKRDIILAGDIRYGVARNVPANDEHGKPVLLAMAVIERDNGAFEIVAIREDKIRFEGEGVIEQEVLRRVYA
jgi:hypothetical protein